MDLAQEDPLDVIRRRFCVIARLLAYYRSKELRRNTIFVPAISVWYNYRGIWRDNGCPRRI
jgi:hypothetical protein